MYIDHQKHFSDKLPGFSEIKELCLNLGIGFCILISTIKLSKNDSVKANFKLSTQAALNEVAKQPLLYSTTLNY